MKKTIALLLAMVMLTGLLAGCGGDNAIVGTWEVKLELVEQMQKEIDELGMGDYLSLDSYSAVLRFTFNDDGTYSYEADRGSLEQSLEGMKQALRDGLIAYADEMIAEQGLEGVTAEEVYEATGTSLDELIDQAYTEEDLDGVVEDLSAEGNYKTKDGKLYLSDGLDHIPDDEIYYNYTIEGDTLTLVDGVGEDEEFSGMFPMILKKIG